MERSEKTKQFSFIKSERGGMERKRVAAIGQSDQSGGGERLKGTFQRKHIRKVFYRYGKDQRCKIEEFNRENSRGGKGNETGEKEE